MPRLGSLSLADPFHFPCSVGNSWDSCFNAGYSNLTEGNCIGNIYSLHDMSKLPETRRVDVVIARIHDSI